jgi:2-C-methyl-D-erythritol 4-phosphate cytidylyltransferase/2-C-methyl-D-erythritol 2,4-cyclodiphosphate synthase
MHNDEAFRGGHTGAVLVAAGAGSRAGGEIPKQFQLLGGKPVLIWSLNALLQCEEISAVAVVGSPSERARMLSILPSDHRILLVEGGAERTDSVRAGLQSLDGRGVQTVLIHDAARPGLSVSVIHELLVALEKADAAAPALPVADALKDSRSGLRSVDRSGLIRVQTPQAFRFDVIRRAIANASSAVDDLALVEAAGARIELTPGRHELMKVTHPEDLSAMEKLLVPQPQASMRVGTGFDVHGFVAGDGVTICGVRIPHTKKLEGHSDADVGWHALTDAILGAAALGDLGDHFPPSDPKWKNANSLLFLQHVAQLAADRGLRVVNADITLMCEKPKIAPHREAMRAKTAEALAVPLDAISVKATTTEKLGFLGREEGIAAQAVVLLSA